MPLPPGDAHSSESRSGPTLNDLIALATPEHILRHPHADGRGVSVCVMDSGVERTLLENRCHARGHILEGLEGGVFVLNRPEPLPYEGRQSTPHGTTVADILLTIAPRI